jgi:HAD superfamily hydrolase (TIGR01509 family)
MSTALVGLALPAAVIFDLDGTLVDTVETRIQAWLTVFAESGIAADRSVIAELIGSDGRRLAREVSAAAGFALAPGRDETIDARCGEIYAALNTEPRPLPGATELLARLEAVGIPWAIATSSRREQVAASVSALRLASEPLVIDGSHVLHAKPAPDLLLLAAGQLAVPPDRCWYVGDATWDMRAAVAAGMIAVGVTSGVADAATLHEAGAVATIASLTELGI